MQNKKQEAYNKSVNPRLIEYDEGHLSDELPKFFAKTRSFLEKNAHLSLLNTVGEEKVRFGVIALCALYHSELLFSCKLRALRF